jgi:hypothetical protein
LKRLLDEAQTGPSRPNSWWIIFIITKHYLQIDIYPEMKITFLFPLNYQILSGLQFHAK